MHCRAKFGQNRSKGGRDMVIFQFFQGGGRRHLGFLKFQTFNGRTVRRLNCIAMSNLVEIGQNATEIWQFFDFSRW